jgi:hypothetical protein
MYLGPETVDELSTDLKVLQLQLQHVKDELTIATSSETDFLDEGHQWPLAPELIDHFDHVKLYYPNALKRYQSVNSVLQSAIQSTIISDADITTLAQSEIPKMMKLAKQLNDRKILVPK